jgi:hypothetical protein
MLPQHGRCICSESRMELIRLCVLSLALVLHHLIGMIVSEQEPEAGQLVVRINRRLFC